LTSHCSRVVLCAACGDIRRCSRCPYRVCALLRRYRADIEALDAHSRTPLFIACAMNRDHCADYLIQCLDHSVHVAAAPVAAAGEFACNGGLRAIVLPPHSIWSFG
jgi:hypothetical protein